MSGAFCTVYNEYKSFQVADSKSTPKIFMLIPQIRKQNTLFKEGAEFFHQNNFVESIIFWILMTCLPQQWTRSAMKIYIPINQEVNWLIGCASKTDLVQMGGEEGGGE